MIPEYLSIYLCRPATSVASSESILATMVLQSSSYLLRLFCTFCERVRVGVGVRVRVGVRLRARARVRVRG